MQSNRISDKPIQLGSKIQNQCDKLKQNTQNSNNQKSQKRVSMSTVDSESSSKNQTINFVQKFQNKRKRIRNSLKSRSISSNRFSSPINEQKQEQQSQQQICLICFAKLSSSYKFSMGCDHLGCQTCLHSYIINKMNQHNQIFCFNLSCKFVLNPKSELFATLPGPIQSEYKKIIQKMNQSKNTEQTVLNFKDNNQKKVSYSENQTTYKKQISQNQIYLSRQKEIDVSNLTVPQVNIYKECKLCNKTTKKVPFINKLKCECGHQFCYFCRQQWEKQGHICKYLLMFNTRFKINNQSLETQPKSQFAQYTKKQKSGTIKAIFLLIVWILLIIVILIPKFLIKSILVAMISIIAGITFYTCAYVWTQNKAYKKILTLFFYPFVMFIGIGMAFANFFTTHLMEQLYLFKRGNQFFLEF